MVIQKFNRLIRNKWVWGVFAVAVSAAFCFDDIFTSNRLEEGGSSAYGKLNGEPVDGKLYEAISGDLRRMQGQRGGEVDQKQIREVYAALKVAEKTGLTVDDAAVQDYVKSIPAFQENGAFSFELYQRRLAESNLTAPVFEGSVKRQLTLSALNSGVLLSSGWVSPMEVDQAVAARTDRFTVRVARFAQDAKAAQAIKLTDDELKDWYAANTNSLVLPERIKIRYVKFDATDKKILAKMPVTAEAVQEFYEAVKDDRFTSVDTNGVDVVKPFDSVKADLESELRQIAAVEYFGTNVAARVYEQPAAAGSSRLDEIAKEDGLKVETSAWFAPSGQYRMGFMAQISSICPGAGEFRESVSELDASDESLRYAIVNSDKSVWLIEKAETSPEHIPTFEEAKDPIRPRALHDARAKAFKAEVEAVAAAGVEAVLATKNVSTNLTFSIDDVSRRMTEFEDAMPVAMAARNLSKGEVSEFTLTGEGKAILVVCQDRVPAEVSEQEAMRQEVANQLRMMKVSHIASLWQEWNLKRLNFVSEFDETSDAPVSAESDEDEE